MRAWACCDQGGSLSDDFVLWWPKVAQSRQIIRLRWGAPSQTSWTRTSGVEPQSCRFTLLRGSSGDPDVQSALGTHFWEPELDLAEQTSKDPVTKDSLALRRKPMEQLIGEPPGAKCLLAPSCGADPQQLKCWLGPRRQDGKLWSSDPQGLCSVCLLAGCFPPWSLSKRHGYVAWKGKSVWGPAAIWEIQWHLGRVEEIIDQGIKKKKWFLRCREYPKPAFNNKKQNKQ